MCHTPSPEKGELCLAIGARILALYLKVIKLKSSQLKGILVKMRDYVKEQRQTKISAYAMVSTLQVRL